MACRTEVAAMGASQGVLTPPAPRVSAVIAFYNAEPFLQEAIDSVLTQTFGDWELLLVDDGSTDASSETARRAASRASDRIRVLAHPGGENRGLPASRNLGTRHARGDLIALLDADDVWLPDKLARQVAALDHHPTVGAVYGSSEWWYSWTGRAEDRARDCVPDLHVASGVPHPPPSLLPVFLRRPGVSPCPASVVVRRDVVARVGLWEEQFRGLYALYEDQALYSKLAVTTPILRLDDCVARYRQHPEQMTTKRPPADHAAARRYYLEWLRDRLGAAGGGYGEVRDVIAAEYRALVPTFGDRVRQGASRLVRSVGRRVVPAVLHPSLRELRKKMSRSMRKEKAPANPG